jgi:hypothetical protein
MPKPITFKSRPQRKATTPDWITRYAAQKKAAALPKASPNYEPAWVTANRAQRANIPNAPSTAGRSPLPNWMQKLANTMGTAGWTSAMSTSPALVNPSPSQYAAMATGNPIYNQDYASHFGNQYTAPRVNRTSQFMQQVYPTPGVRRTTTRNFAQLPEYMRPGYVPGVNTAQQMPEKTYRKIFHQPMTVAMQTYPQGYAEQANQPYTSGGYGGYGDYGYGGGGGYNYTPEPGYTGNANYQSNKGYRPYSNDVPRWLQGLVTWRF